MRRIVVDGESFRWRFDGTLVVIPAESSGPQLSVAWGWTDGYGPDGLGPEPQFVTPNFVAAAVRCAVALGWRRTPGGQPLRLGFAHGQFTVS